MEFVSKVRTRRIKGRTLYEITVPIGVARALKLKHGDYVEVRISRVEGVDEELYSEGPFILGLLTSVLKSAKAAKRVLEEKGSSLTASERAYLEHVVEDGRRAEEMFECIKQRKRLSASSP